MDPKTARKLREKALKKLIAETKYEKSKEDYREPASMEPLKKSYEYKSFQEEKDDINRLKDEIELAKYMKGREEDPEENLKRIKSGIDARLAEEAPELDLERKARMEYLRRKRQGK